MKHMKTWDTIALLVLIVAGICWGLLGALNFDLIGTLFNGGSEYMSPLSRIIFVIFGLAGIYRLVMWIRCKNCKK